VVTREVVVVAPKVDFWIQFTTDRKFEQRVDMLKWVHDLSKELGFVAARLKIYIRNIRTFSRELGRDR
jgi:hypothetical protein